MTLTAPFIILLAALPILLILVLMVLARWPAAHAGAVGLIVTALLAVFAFGYGTEVYPELGTARALAGAIAEAGSSAATILWIIFPALCIYGLGIRTGSILALRQWLARLSADRRIIGLLVAWFLALFFEGAAGFGTPIALTAPFLVSLGFPPVEAVALALIGHAVGVSFGAVGAPVAAQVQITGYAPLELANTTGLYHALLGWVMALIVTWSILRALKGKVPDEPTPMRGTIWLWTLVAAVLFIVPYRAVSVWVGPELPSMMGGLLGGVAFVFLVREGARRGWFAAGRSGEEDDLPANALWRAVAPYLVLVTLILATRLLPLLRAALQRVPLEWQLYETFSGGLLPLYHPGTMLLAAFLIGAALQRARARDVREVVGEVLQRLVGISLALVAMLGLSRLMVHARLTDALALAAADGLGPVWPLVAPFVGVLGTFITGSATASNILFTDFQLATARDLGLPALLLIGTQGFGAAVGNIICPHNIIAGGATVGLDGREGDVLRRTLWPALVYAALGGVLALVLARAA